MPPTGVDISAPCVEWTGYFTGNGYGGFRRDGRWLSAHTEAYVEAKGPVPEGLEIDHVCRNTRCVNPLHLEAVTHAENIRRAYPTCKAGHEWTPASTYNTPEGWRRCRICHTARERERQDRLRARAG